jgi:hypothetical protein
MEHWEEASSQILITRDPAFENSISLDVLRLYWIYQRRAILPSVWQNNRDTFSLNHTSVLCEYTFQVEDCYPVSEESVADRIDTRIEYVRRYFGWNNQIVF